MATLVLSTVGTVLGGPIGGMLGTLVGGAIDAQLLGGGPRQGPRLGDLTVQTSSYGTMIPRIYGTMRVAGTVVWSTDLTETSELAGDGKSGPQTEVYSYSASFAVALSSRPAQRVRRIWADGKLVRGMAGDLKVEGKFRFVAGTEGQMVDPLIASLEGSGKAPAYRGLALAVFEDLQLGSFGNRIPVLTFELVANDGPEELGAVLRDGSRGAIDCGSTKPVAGYALYGNDIASAVAPLVEAHALDLTDEGDAFRQPSYGAALAVGPGDLGAGADDEPGSARPERKQYPAAGLPNSLGLTYYDASRDFQSGQARASLPGERYASRTVSLPCVIAASEAKAMADRLLARDWAMRERLTVRLPMRFLTLAPGAQLSIHGIAGIWIVDTVTIERAVVIAECRPAWRSAGTRVADPGRPAGQPDVVALPSRIVLLDLSDALVGGASPSLQVAIASPSNTYQRIPLQVDVGGVVSSSRSAAAETVIGDVVGVLADGQIDVVDPAHVVDVRLVNDDHWLVSADEAALASGANMAAIGNEVVQYAQAEPIGPGLFRLSGLRRGRQGSEAAMTGHAASETFVLLSEASLAVLSFTEAQVGMVATVTALGVGNSANPPSANRVITA